MKLRKNHFPVFIVFVLLLLGYFIQPSSANEYASTQTSTITDEDDDVSGINIIDIKIISPLPDETEVAAATSEANEILSAYE